MADDSPCSLSSVYPPGPFPPSGEEPEGVVDLGIRLRDTLFQRTLILEVRTALQSNLRAAARSPRQLLMALPTIDAYLDTWPVAALIDDALATWRRGPEPRALGVLHRAAEVVGAVLGWPRTVDRRWPLPDEAWMRSQLPGPCQVHRRGPRDGSAAVAVALDASFGAPAPIPLPPALHIHGDELGERLEEALRALDAGSVHYVEIDGWIPWDDASQEAVRRLRRASPLQAAYDRFGVAALAAGGGVPFEEQLTDAPPGTVADRMRCTGEATVVPSFGAEGTIQPLGVLCWDAPYRPVKVTPAAIGILQAIDHHRDLDRVAAQLRITRRDLDGLVEQLAEVGAVTAERDHG